MDLSELQRLWGLVERRWQEAEALRDSPGGALLTARKLDEGSPGGTRLYITAMRLLGVARENMEALFSLLGTQRGATPAAPYNLIRPAFEASFHAAWLLDPERGANRRARGLQLEVLDQKARYNVISEFRNSPDLVDFFKAATKEHAEGEQALRNEASALGVAWNDVTQQVNVRDAVGNLRLAQDAEIPSLLRAQWRTLSGYQHGQGSALFDNSEVTLLAPFLEGDVPDWCLVTNPSAPRPAPPSGSNGRPWVCGFVATHGATSCLGNHPTHVQTAAVRE